MACDILRRRTVTTVRKPSTFDAALQQAASPSSYKSRFKLHHDPVIPVLDDGRIIGSPSKPLPAMRQQLVELGSGVSSTRLDYSRIVAEVLSSLEKTAGGVIDPNRPSIGAVNTFTPLPTLSVPQGEAFIPALSPLSGSSTGAGGADLLAEVRLLPAEMVAQTTKLASIDRASTRQDQTLRDWDRVGLPGTRIM